MVVPRFVRQALRGEPITVYGDGQQSRCFGDVDDVIGAVHKLSEHPGAVGKVFNIGSTQEVTILELAERVIALTQSKSEIIELNGHTKNEIIAAISSVPGSQWKILVKAEIAYLKSEKRELLFDSFLLGSLMIIFLISAILALYNAKIKKSVLNELENKRLFQFITESVNDVIWILSLKENKFTYVSPSVSKLRGFTAEEVINSDFKDNLTPESYNFIISNLHERIKLVEIGEPGFRTMTHEIDQPCKNGSIVNTEVITTMLLNEGGKVNEILGVSRNITDRKRAEKALIESEDRLRQITNIMPQIIWTNGPDWVIDYCNSRYEEYTGLRDLNDQTINEIVFQEDLIHCTKKWREALITKESFEIEIRLKAKNNQYRWFLAVCVPYMDKSGKIKKWVGSATDIHDLKTAKQSLHNLNIKLEKLVKNRTRELSDLYNNAPCGYHSINKDGYFTRVNDTALKWLGYERDELLKKKKITDILPDTQKHIFYDNFPRLLETDFISNVQVDMVRKDGSLLPVLLNASVVRNKNGKFLMTRTTIVDHTQRKEFETEIMHLNKTLVENDRRLNEANKDLESFAYSVSHDLRAPLRAIDGYTRMLREIYFEQLEDEGKRKFLVIEDNAKRMSKLIDDLLKFSRATSHELKKTKINIYDIVVSVSEELRQFNPEQKIEFFIHELPDCHGDYSLIKQVWFNLISNAVKFSKTRPVSTIEIEAKNHNNEIIYSIKDNGVGFDMQFSNKLFNVFQRLHTLDEFPGSGVGLALVKNIINKHKGRIWAYSEIDKGSTFCFSLPE